MTAPEGTPLETGFSFFFMRRGKAAQSEKLQQKDQPSNNGEEKDGESSIVKTSSSKPSYFDAVKIIGTIHTVEQFWSLYDHLIRPSSLPTTTDLHVFRQGIQPTWEDPSNARGGKWIVRLKKGLASRYWEEIILAMIGGQFVSSTVAQDEICGAVVSIRFNEDIVSVWNRNAGNRDVCERVRDAIKRILHLPNHVHMEYKPHQDSLMDKSSFRNTQVWRPKSLDQHGQHGHGMIGRSNSNIGEGGNNADHHHHHGHHHNHPGQPRRMGSWGENSNREDGSGGGIGGGIGKKPLRSEVERAWR